MAALQNKIAYITGSSRGIGEALVRNLLNEGFKVVGISRTAGISAVNFKHISLDLMDLNAVKSFEFEDSADHVVLINNAGVLGDIAPIGTVDDDVFEYVMNVNTIAPQILMNRFLHTFKSDVQSGHILNISSGAGKSPIDAWATYCASKAAIDLFSRTIQHELELHEVKNWFIHSVAPGVVDTAMQSEIRDANPQLFKSVDRFKSLKNDAQLASPEFVADKLVHVILNPSAFNETVISVRDF